MLPDLAHAHKLRQGHRPVFSGVSGAFYVAGVIEVIYCEGCDLGVPRPDGMPDYSQVDRWWGAPVDCMA